MKRCCVAVVLLALCYCCTLFVGINLLGEERGGCAEVARSTPRGEGATPLELQPRQLTVLGFELCGQYVVLVE